MVKKSSPKSELQSELFKTYLQQLLLSQQLKSNNKKINEQMSTQPLIPPPLPQKSNNKIIHMQLLSPQPQSFGMLPQPPKPLNNILWALLYRFVKKIMYSLLLCFSFSLLYIVIVFFCIKKCA